MAASLLVTGQLCFAAIGAVVGIRLLRECVAEHKLGLPALTTGAIFVGGIGLLSIQVGTAIGESAIGRHIAMAGEIAMRTGIMLLCVFVWKTFRPSGWPGTLGAAFCAIMLFGTLVWDMRVQAGWWPYEISIPSAHASQLAIALPFAWSSAESFTLWRRLRRQRALGLADPVLCNRFALWTIATAAFVGICALAIVAGRAQAHGLMMAADAAQIGRGVLYLVVTGSIWLGIFTPGAFRERLEAAS